MFRWNRWNIESWIPLEETLSEHKELLVSSGHVDFTEAVLALDSIHIMLVVTCAHKFNFDDEEVEDAIVGFDVVYIACIFLLILIFLSFLGLLGR